MIVGLTGGIGSGKSTVAEMFEELGVPIYISDSEAKRLMHENTQLKSKIIELFGNSAYINSVLNRSYVASIVFENPSMLKKLNELVHPVVAKDFTAWATSQDAPFVIQESAILFENDGYKRCDYTVVVTSPMDLRIQRLIKRDKTSEEAIRKRMKTQWSDVRKIGRADAHIENITRAETQLQVTRVYDHLLRRVRKGW